MMGRDRGRFAAVLVVLAAFSIAPARPFEQPAAPRASSKAEERYQAAQKQYEITWSYYQQARIDSFQVYVWSRFMMDAQRERDAQPAGRRAALEQHLERMKKLEELIKKVRRIGFGRSYDVGASEYYRLEAEFWLEQARRGK